MSETGNQESTAKDPFQAEFEALPLDQKFAKLFKMEAVAIGEAIQYAVNSPMKVVENVGEVLNKVGDRIESEFKKASCSSPFAEPGEPNPPPAEPANETTSETEKKSPRRSNKG